MSSRLAESRETVSYIFFGVNNYIFHIFILKYYCYPHYYPQESISFVLFGDPQRFRSNPSGAVPLLSVRCDL